MYFPRDNNQHFLQSFGGASKTKKIKKVARQRSPIK